MRQLMVLLACACAWALCTAPTAGAVDFICDPDDPAVNMWDGAPGNWSDGGHWSKGTPPSASDLACVDSTVVFDTDATVDRLLLWDDATIPVGRTITARHAYVDGSVAGTLRVGADGQESTLNGPSLAITGTLETHGTVATDASDLIIVGSGTSTIDVTGRLTATTIDVTDDLAVLGAGVLSSDMAMVGGSITGTGSIEATSLVLGSRPGLDRLSVSASSAIRLVGDVDVTGNVTVPGMIELDGNVSIDGAVLAVPDGLFSASGDAGARLALTGGTSVTGMTFARTDGPTLAFDDCTLPAAFGGADGLIDVGDIGCIDPPAGVARELGGDVTFTGSGTLDAGGTLTFGDSLRIAAGVTLTDGATSLRMDQTAVRIAGTGEVHVVDLDVPPGEYFFMTASAGQTLILDTPKGGAGSLASMRFIVTTGGGIAEIRDPSPRSTGWTGGDQVDAGSEPVRYRSGGSLYEPLRNMLFMRGGSWTPTGVGRTLLMEGFGTIDGTVEADGITASGGTLDVDGTIDADTAAVRHASGAANGVLDLAGATSQRIGSFAVQGPDLPAAVPTVTASDERVVAPGLARTFIGIAPTRITVPNGLAYRVTAGSGALDLVDAIAPSPVSNVTSSSHASSSTDTTIDVTWNAAADAGTSPVAGYAVTFTPASDSDPGSTITTTTTVATSATLAPGTWWVHVRAIDGVGNLGAVIHGGPYSVTPATTCSSSCGTSSCTGDADCDGTPDALEPVVRIGTWRANVLLGRGGADRLSGAGGNDTLRGFGGADVLHGGTGRDLLEGGYGNDRLLCGPGAGDRAFGGPGADATNCRDLRPSLANRDVVNCGAGRDTAIVDRFDVVRGCERVLRR